MFQMPTIVDLRQQLSELNYLYPFSEDSVSLIHALLRDLVSTVTTYKALETEHEITREELRLAVEEITKLGSIVREKNQLQIALGKARDEVEVGICSGDQRAAAAEERALELELIVSQLRFENKQLECENRDLRLRMDQLLVEGNKECGHNEIFLPHTDMVVDNVFTPIEEENWEFRGPEVKALKSEIGELESTIADQTQQLEKINKKYEQLEAKFLEQSPVTLSGTWVGLGPSDQNLAIQQLNERLDFLNEKYRDLKLEHAKCSAVGPKTRKDLDVRKKNSYNLELETRVNELENELESIANGDLVIQLKEEAMKSKREFDSLNRALKDVQNEVKSKDKELRALRGAMRNGDRGHDSRKLQGQVALLEEKLRQVTEDRDELIEKLDEIDRSIQSMESEILKIESENCELKRERAAKEEAFIGISKQLQEVNAILNSLTEDVSGSEEIERLKFKISQLEREKRELEKEVDTHRSRGDLEGLVRSLTAAKDQAVAGMKSLQAELSDVRTKAEANRDFVSEIFRLKSSLTRMDGERDELQIVCDDQAEKLELLRQENSVKTRELSEALKSLSAIRFEYDRVKQQLDDKDNQVRRLNHLTVEIERKEIQVRALQTEVTNANREISEITRDNQMLSNELVRMRNNIVSMTHSQVEIENVLESLRLTEKERNDVVSLYRKVADENKVIGNSLDKISLERMRFEELAKSKEMELVKAAQANHQLAAQCRQAELEIAALRAKCFSSPKIALLEAENASLNEQIKDLVGLVELERSKAKLMSIEPPKISESDSPEALRQTIEQQYILIGEMDAEQAKLILENTRLREQLQAST